MSIRESGCEAIEPLLAPYGEPDGPAMSDDERALVVAHLASCAPCRHKSDACRAACAALRANAAALQTSAPPHL
nr:zf-HC2 domain-containing protein [Acidobacteriota bacterium]